MQQGKPVLTELYKIHLGRIGAKVSGIALGPRQNPFLDQGFKADHVGISRECGIGLIG